MAELSLDEAKDAAEEARSDGLRENEAGITPDLRVDYDEHDVPTVVGHPETLITYEYIAGVTINAPQQDDLLSAEKNLEGGGPKGYGNQASITLAGPTLAEGTLWAYPDDEYNDFKVIGDPENEDNDYEIREKVIRDEDGEIDSVETTGIDLGPTNFDGEQVDGGFDHEYIQVNVSARRAGSILGALDTAGQWSHDTDGALTEGILEAPPNLGSDGYDPESDGVPRLCGYPELRADMVGQAGAIAWTYGSTSQSGNRAVNVDVFKITDDGLEALVPLEPDDDEYARPSYPRGGNCLWSHSADGAEGSDADPETDAGLSDVSGMMDDINTDTEETPDTVGYEDLAGDDVAFVDMAAEIANKKGLDSVDGFTDIGDGSAFEERVETADADLTYDADVYRRIINDQFL